MTPATLTRPTQPTRTTAPAPAYEARRTRVGSYVLPAGERIIYRVRDGQDLRLIDAPAPGEGRDTYIIESGLQQDPGGAVDALVLDYLAHAKRHRTIPAAPGGIHWLI